MRIAAFFILLLVASLSFMIGGSFYASVVENNCREENSFTALSGEVFECRLNR